MEESHNFYLNDYTEFVKQATDIIESNKNSKNYVIMYADLTNFKLVNDFYGFIEGDRFLLEFAKFLSMSPRTILCGRVFSDHFLRLSLFEDNCDIESVTRNYEQKLETFISSQEEHHPDSKIAVAAGLCPVKLEEMCIRDRGCTPGTPYKKSARIVGEVMGKYHPHGDSSIYEALVLSLIHI